MKLILGQNIRPTVSAAVSRALNPSETGPVASSRSFPFHFDRGLFAYRAARIAFIVKSAGACAFLAASKDWSFCPVKFIAF